MTFVETDPMTLVRVRARGQGPCARGPEIASQPESRLATGDW
jgi:hypothetical protein